MHCEVGAGFHRLAVDVDGTGTAMARFAADVGAGEIELFTQEMNEQGARFDGLLMRAAVDLKGDELFGHGKFLGSFADANGWQKGGFGGSR